MHIVRNTHGPELYVATHDPSAPHDPQPPEMLAQPDLGSFQHKDKIEQCMKVSDGFFCRPELRFLLVNDLNYTRLTAMKTFLMQGIEKHYSRALHMATKLQTSK